MRLPVSDVVAVIAGRVGLQRLPAQVISELGGLALFFFVDKSHAAEERHSR